MIAERIELTAAERTEFAHLRRRQCPRKALARQLGISVGALVKWERGERCPTVESFQLWRESLGIEVPQ